MRTGSIYIIRNTVNSKVYIGQTTMTVQERFRTHTKSSTLKAKQHYKLYTAMRKYGAEKFYVETLLEEVPLEALNQKEIELIEKFDSFRNGYNSTPGGDGRIISKVSDEEEMLRLAENGHKAEEIADSFGVDKVTVFRTLHRLGFRYHANPEKIIELAESGCSNEWIAGFMNCSVATVGRTLDRAGKRKHRKPIKNRDSFDYDSLLKDYYAQTPIVELCKKYGITKTTFYRIKAEKGFATRPQIYKTGPRRSKV